ncbi:MCE family protein [Mycobacterium branderi]|uniref:MCE-family protein MCE3A n=1 Tax=Mycobacterium branderi TaxID=43348 RepID=A0A7I7WH15_9MYCO|nr:MCE family protein [Mycobacterium branderi]MCV7236333.1 MCE family protein [Mycobacterium branderi]ORA35498.1 MCE-family protein MCE3A [Mycobacterium branderi]BBZ15218.1 virulence factor [Mycobacterium branderi]
MEARPGERRLHPALCTLILLAVIGLFAFVTFSLFAGTFASYVPVTLTADRSGLVMELGAKVKMRGVQVGRVGTIHGGNKPVTLTLQLYPDQIRHIPANVQARIRATTVFGAKYVDLVYPKHPSAKRISAGSVITSENVSTEVNTVFQNLTDLLNRIDPAKLNSVLTALSQGLRGEGPTIGQATSDANEVLLALNPRAETMRNDWQSVSGFSDTYSAAARDILAVLDSASTTSSAITDNSRDLDAALVNVIGLAQSGVNLIASSKDNLVNAVNSLEPTTSLLFKYNPELTCLIVGGKYFLDHGGYDAAGGGDGKSTIVDAAILLGDDPYRYPDNLPVVGAKGGPGGQPGCGSLPDVAKNWPLRQLITNTGWGTGIDWRPNPGIGFPGWADYFPVTRGAPKPPSIRHPGGPAPGPMPYPGAPPYGAPMYAPDGTPLYPGLPPAPAPGAPKEPGPPPPGSEPFSVPAPASQQPTPLPPLPTPALPSP